MGNLATFSLRNKKEATELEVVLSEGKKIKKMLMGRAQHLAQQDRRLLVLNLMTDLLIQSLLAPFVTFILGKFSKLIFIFKFK